MREEGRRGRAGITRGISEQLPDGSGHEPIDGRLSNERRTPLEGAEQQRLMGIRGAARGDFGSFLRTLPQAIAWRHALSRARCLGFDGLLGQGDSARQLRASRRSGRRELGLALPVGCAPQESACRQTGQHGGQRHPSAKPVSHRPRCAAVCWAGIRWAGDNSSQRRRRRANVSGRGSGQAAARRQRLERFARIFGCIRFVRIHVYFSAR